MDLESIYKQNEENMPSFPTILAIRKILLIKKILEIEPDITLKYKTDLFFEALHGAYFDCEWKSDILISPECNNSNVLSLITALKSTDKQFENYVLRYSSQENMDYEESYSYLNNNIKNFTFHDLLISKTSFKELLKDEISYVVEGCNQEEAYYNFIEGILNDKEYTPENISLYGLDIPTIPVTIDNTYNHKYQEWGILKDYFVLEQVTNFIKQSLESVLTLKLLDKLEKPCLLLLFQANTFTLTISEETLSNVIYENKYTSQVSKFDYLIDNDFVLPITDKNKIFDYNSMDFIIEHISEVNPHGFNTNNTLLDILTHNEKVILSNEFINHDNNLKVNKRL